METEKQIINEESDDGQKKKVNEAFNRAMVYLKSFGIDDLTDRELIYLHDEASKAVELDRIHLDEMESLQSKGVGEDNPDYWKIDAQRPDNLGYETLCGWFERYLGIPWPSKISGDVPLTPINSVALRKEEKGDFGSQKDVGDSPAEQSQAFDIARDTQRSEGNARPLYEYYHRNEVFSYEDENLRKYLRSKLEKRRAESEVSDIER